jgi:DNA replication protein
MKASDRESGHADFLGGSFVSIPAMWLSKLSQLGLSPAEFLILVQILAASQLERQDFLTPQELALRSGMTAMETSEHIGNLVNQGFLSIGERLEENGTHSNYYDLKPLWSRLRGRDPLNNQTREWRKDVVTLFEEEFGRPLSGLECEQIRQWMERDGHAEWIITEALREAVLANKYSFKYIDRILYDWQRNRIRTRSELEAYRESYRERIKGKSEAAAASQTSGGRPTRRSEQSATGRDERYSAFYQLFPDTN